MGVDKMNWKQKFEHYKIFHFLGLFLLALAIIVWAVSLLELVRNEIMLSNAQPFRLSVEEIWMYNGALQWWKSIYASVIIPITLILALAGITTVFYSQLLSGEGILLRIYPFDFLEKKELPKMDNCDEHG
jgi:hypothetical protein